MTNQVHAQYALNLDQCVNLISTIGKQRTVLAQGDMGQGKSSMLTMLAEKHPDYVPVYFDATTKDLGDLMIPSLQSVETDGCVRMIPNEELGLHHDKPIILMIDEFGKANPSVKNGLLRLMLERKVGSVSLHPDSIVFATTNKTGEGVGDMLPPHACNRIITVQIRKSTHLEVIDFGINDGWDHSLLGCINDNPQLCQSYEDVKDPSENLLIFHPKAQRAAFSTPRSLHACSDILKQREHLDDVTLQAALIGAVGDQAAALIMTHVKMSDQLPSLESIKTDPKNAIVPTSVAAVCMVVYRTLSLLEKDWIKAWMEYMQRLDTEAQAMFANGVRSEKYSKRSMMMGSSEFRDWALKNQHLYTADV